MAFEELIDAAAKKYSLDPHLLAAIMMQESGGDPQQVGRKTKSGEHASGLMQLMPETAKSLGVTDVFDPAQNIDAGARYFQQMLDRFSGDPRKALAAYNAGPTAVEQYGDVPPYEETQNYVKNILKRSGDASPRGMETHEATGPDGNKIRIHVPIGADKAAIKTMYETEFNRRGRSEQQRKETVQPVKGSNPYTFAREAVKESPGAVGRVLDPRNLVRGELGTGFGGSDEVTPESLKRGMSGEDIPIVGSLIRLTKGEFSPREAADWAISLGQGGLGGALRHPRVRAGMRAAATEPGVSKAGAGLGSAAGGAAGAETAKAFGLPYQVGLYPGMAAGGALGAKVPSAIRGFSRGFQEPYTKSAPINVVDAEFVEPQPSGPRQLGSGTAGYSDIRGQRGPFYGGQPTAETPPSGLPQGPGNVTEMHPSTGPALPAGPARVFQMPRASEVPIYGGKPRLARSSESGMYVPRQRTLPLYQEGANIPETSPSLTPEEIGQKLAPNIRRQGISKVGEERQPQPTSKQLEKAEEKPPKAEVKEMPKKVVLPATVKEHARIHGQSVEEAEKYYKDQGYEIRKRSLKKKD